MSKVSSNQNQNISNKDVLLIVVIIIIIVINPYQNSDISNIKLITDNTFNKQLNQLNVQRALADIKRTSALLLVITFLQ